MKKNTLHSKYITTDDTMIITIENVNNLFESYAIYYDIQCSVASWL